MNATWIKITFTPAQVEDGAPERVEHIHQEFHQVNDQIYPLVGLFEKVPCPDDGSRIYFFTPESLNNLRDVIEAYSWEFSSAPKGSEVRPAGAPFAALQLLDAD